MSTWVDRLLGEYAGGKKQLIAYKQTVQDPMEAKIVNGMIAELHYSMLWMRRGSDPGTIRGTQAIDAYRYAELRDMEMFPALDLEVEDEMQITDTQKRAIIRVLLKLSVRERQCYLMHVVQGLSYAKIAEELGIAKGVVNTYIKRAKLKIQQATES